MQCKQERTNGYKRKRRLQGKVAFVTGAGGGIGRAAALALLAKERASWWLTFRKKIIGKRPA
jgi:FlaA1/EpsC-like NDP-sugar epimerase